MLYSVIIPCYNVAQYLSRTLDSILCQDKNNYEIILVNDGSQDDTLNIIIEYAAKYDCIKVINQQNKGVSAARNAGIKIAEGTYLAFVDADDTISPLYFSTLNKYIANNPDIIFFGFNHYKEELKATKVYVKPNSNKILFNILTYRTKCNLWSGIYRTSLIQKNNIWFDENTYYNEDKEFFINAIISTTSEKICIVNEILYNYLFNSTSAMRVSGFTKKQFTAIDANKRMYDLMCNKYGLNSHIAKAMYNRLLYSYIVNKKKSFSSKSFNEMRDMFSKYKWLMDKFPPYVNSIFYYNNVINMIFCRRLINN